MTEHEEPEGTTGPNGSRENQESTPDRPSRRTFMVGGAALGAFGALSGRRAGRLTSAQARLLDKVTATSAASNASLSDIKHVVILMQENRSFDHYFGTLSGVRGFSDPHVLTQTVGGRTYPVFDQFGFQPGTGPDATGYLQPFHLLNDPPLKDGETTNDITHSWGPQHQSWNNGAMNQFMAAHLASDGDENGPVTMGYFTRADLAFYYALADAFTVCDHYFCSVLGPTDPNRLMGMSAWIDPAGTNGGPVVETFDDRVAEYGKLSWETMPERLLAAGVSWKVYNDPTGLIGLSPLPYFKAYNNPFSITGFELVSKALTPVYPSSFALRRQGRQAAVGVVDHPAAGRVRAPGRAARVRRVPRPADPHHADVEPGCLGADGVPGQLRRERRVLRPRAAAGGAGGHGGGTPDRQSAIRCVRHRRADRARLPHARPGHLAVQPGRLRGLRRPSTTPRRCASSRRCSAWKSPTCRRGGAASPVTCPARWPWPTRRTPACPRSRRPRSATRPWPRRPC